MDDMMLNMPQNHSALYISTLHQILHFTLEMLGCCVYRSLLVISDELPLSPRHEQAKRLLERARLKARSNHVKEDRPCRRSYSDQRPIVWVCWSTSCTVCFLAISTNAPPAMGTVKMYKSLTLVTFLCLFQQYKRGINPWKKWIGELHKFVQFKTKYDYKMNDTHWGKQITICSCSNLTTFLQVHLKKSVYIMKKFNIFVFLKPIYYPDSLHISNIYFLKFQ